MGIQFSAYRLFLRLCTFGRLFLIMLAVTSLSVPPAVGASPVLLVMGDSLSAAYGLASGKGWVDLLRQRLRDDGLPLEVVNASISGETTAGGRARIDRLLAEHRPSVVIIELGANDGLRGGSLDAMARNLDYMTSEARKSGARVLLVGMQLPPNFGQAYVSRFSKIYEDVAAQHKVPLVPFFLAGFADVPNFFQADRIHPTAVAQSRLLDNVWPSLRPLLQTSARR